MTDTEKQIEKYIRDKQDEIKADSEKDNLFTQGYDQALTDMYNKFFTSPGWGDD